MLDLFRPHAVRLALGMAACLALPALLPAPLAAQGDFPPAVVIVSEVLEQPLVETVTLVGTVQPRRTSVVASETEGKVTARLKEPGQGVDAGEPLFRLANDALRASLVEALADVKLRRFRHDQSLELLSREAISQDQAQEAEYELDRARSRLQDLQDRLEDLTIRAPFRGSLVVTLVEVGEWVNRGQGVARVVAIDTVRVYANVSERHVSRLHPGDEATVVVDPLGSDSVKASVVAVLAEGYSDSRTFPVVVEFLNPDGRVRGGMSATVRFAIAQDRAELLVHKDAIVTGATGTYLFLAADGAAAMRPVVTGMTHQGYVAVRGDGLRPGDLAVVRGNERLQNGQPVRVVRKLQ